MELIKSVIFDATVRKIEKTIKWSKWMDRTLVHAIAYKLAIRNPIDKNELENLVVRLVYLEGLCIRQEYIIKFASKFKRIKDQLNDINKLMRYIHYEMVKIRYGLINSKDQAIRKLEIDYEKPYPQKDRDKLNSIWSTVIKKFDKLKNGFETCSQLDKAIFDAIKRRNLRKEPSLLEEWIKNLVIVGRRSYFEDCVESEIIKLTTCHHESDHGSVTKSIEDYKFEELELELLALME